MYHGSISKRQKTITAILLAVYLLILTWVVLLKAQTDLSLLAAMNFRSVNLIPFAGSAIVNGRADLSEIFWNMAAFAPLGVYLSMLDDRWRLPRKLAPIAALSLLYEVLQYVFAIGATDITDLLMNTLGGLLGILLFSLLHKKLGSRAVAIVNLLAAVCTAGVFLLAAVLFAANRP